MLGEHTAGESYYGHRNIERALLTVISASENLRRANMDVCSGTLDRMSNALR
jgi:hypothetical protein